MHGGHCVSISVLAWCLVWLCCPINTLCIISSMSLFLCEDMDMVIEGNQMDGWGSQFSTPIQIDCCIYCCIKFNNTKLAEGSTMLDQPLASFLTSSPRFPLLGHKHYFLFPPVRNHCNLRWSTAVREFLCEWWTKWGNTFKKADIFNHVSTGKQFSSRQFIIQTENSWKTAFFPAENGSAVDCVQATWKKMTSALSISCCLQWSLF